MKFNALRLSATASTIALSAAFASPAFADSAAAAAPTPPPATDCSLPANQALPACKSEVGIKSGVAPSSDESIVVTGSRIRRPNLESPVPITSLSQEELTMTGEVNIGDKLNDLPSLRTTFSQANSTRFIGTAGVNNLDLRGLGVSRTLVLVNGRRHITFTPGDYIVDTNTIPTDLIERVDIVTGGESAVYGSDAVAGVVNFILKKSYSGLKLRAQSGISSRGDRNINFITATAGRNFFDNRANVAINLEYINAQALEFKDRPGLTGAFDGRCQFNNSSLTFTGPPSNPTPEPQSGNGVPDQQFFCGVRNATTSNGGTVAAATPVALFDVNGNGRLDDLIPCNDPRVLNPLFVNPATAAQRCLNPGSVTTGANRFLNFSPDGTLCEVIPALDFRPFASGNYIANPADPCARGATLRDTGQIAPGLKRYTGNLLAHFDVTDALKPFVEAKFVRVDAAQAGQPSFFQSTFPAFFGAGAGIRCNNPFLTAQDIAALQTIGRCSGGATSTAMIPLARFNVDFGPREEKIRRDTYRIVGGVEGDFNQDWHYEVSLNYGHLKSRQRELNDLHIFNIDFSDGPFLNAIDAVRNSSGQIVCRINADADPTNDDPNCVPINVLGQGNPSQAALNYVNTTSFVDSTASEFDALAFMSGDSSQIFSLPGGPVGFSLGAEHREERAHQIADPLSAAGATFFNAFPEFSPPALKVNELFGEISLPILKDLPFAHELTVSGAGRYSHYNTSAKNTFAWNANAIWSPVRDLRLRGNYSKSVRVPTQSDLFTPPTQNFAFVQDPCDVAFINNGTTNRPINCAAQGIPVGFVNTDTRNFSLGFVSQGNPDLVEETGRSLTLGGVLTPRWIPGLSLSVDYYKIKVEHLISFLSAQQVLNACYDLPQPNQFCNFIFPRNDDFTFGSPALVSQGANFAKLVADGVDAELAYRHTFSNGHRLNLHGFLTYVIKRDNYIDPSNPTFRDQQLLELGDPRWAANMNIGYGIGRFDVNYSLNYIGKQTIGAYENYFSVQGRPPQNADFTAERFYPEVLYHAVRFDYKLPYRASKTFDFYLGADNIFDTQPKFPQFGSTGVVAGDARDYIGRYFYGGVIVDF